MKKPLSIDIQKELFTEARTVHAFKQHDITDEQIQELYELFKWAPTAFNAQPGRYVFIRSDAAKERLLPALSPGNVPQVKSASLTVIVAGLRNSSLQGAFLIMAVRSLGFDCGAMSGFDPAKVNAEFFTDGRYKANFLLNIGVADPAGIYARGPRLVFDDVVQII